MESYPGVRTPPKTIHFKYPNGAHRRGRVLEEVYEQTASKKYGDYLFVIQRILHDKNFPGRISIRFG